MPHRTLARLSATALAMVLALNAPAMAREAVRKPTAFTLSSGTARTPEQLAVHFDRAALSFDIRPAGRAIGAQARLDFTALSPVSAIVVELDTLYVIDRIEVDGTTVANWTNPDGRLTIPLPHPLAAGETVSVNITYGGQPHVAEGPPWKGGFVWSDSDGTPWVATAVQGEGCDLIWPCIDHPRGEPEQVDLFITVPAGMSAPANGRLIGRQEHGDGSSTWHWRTRTPDTYAITLNAGPFRERQGQYQSRYGNRIPLHFWPLQNVPDDKAQGLFDQLPQMLAFFEAWVGPYPFGDEKVGVVQTPHLGMEHQTINAYGNDYKLDGKGYDWLMQHELAHEWFGNQMTNVSWDDMWLHESFGTYMQPLYARWLHGERAMQAELETMRRTVSNRFAMVSGREQDAATVYNADTGPALDLYYKGALIAHTLRMHIGDEAFRESLRLLVYDRSDPAPGNFRPLYRTTDDYVAIVNRVTGQDWGWFFDAYLRHAALPELVLQRNGDQATLFWKTGSERPFTLPVEVEIDAEPHTLRMDEGRATFHAPASAHIVLDPQSKILRHLPHIEAWKAATTR